MLSIIYRIKDQLVDIFLHHFIFQKLNTWLGFLILLGAGVFLSILVVKLDFPLGGGLAIIMIGAATVIISFFHPGFAFFFAAIISALFPTAQRFLLTTAPFGVSVDIFLVIGLLGLISQKSLHQDRTWEFLKNPVTYIF